MLYSRLFVNIMPVYKYLKNVSFRKVFLNWYYVIYAVILKCYSLLPLVYVIFIVDRIFVFALCSCAVAVTGLVAVVQHLYNKYVNYLFIYFSPPPMPPHVRGNFVVFPPSCGDSVADFWGWDAREARLRCPDDVSGDM